MTVSEHPPELVEKVRDVLAGWPIGNGYYGTKVGTDEALGMAREALDAIAETHAVVDKALIARALAYGAAFRTPAAAGARAALREAAGMEPPHGTEADR
jgi:hypothetical protein